LGNWILIGEERPEIGILLAEIKSLQIKLLAEPESIS